MIGSRFRRLGMMDRDEIVSRVGAASRVRLQRLAMRMRSSRWNRRAVANVLAPAVMDADLGAAIDRADWNAAHRLLEDKIRARPSRFVLDPREAAGVREQIVRRWPDAPEHASHRADRILAGEFDLLGYRGLRFGRDGQAIDWHFDPVHQRTMPTAFWADVAYLDPQHGDHKIIWELNRHQHWLALGRAMWLADDAQDDRYGQAMLSDLHSWIDSNPPLVGANWASMLELAFRCQSWVWGMHFLLADPATPGGEPSADAHKNEREGERSTAARGPWLVDMLVALDRQLTHVEQNLSYYFSPNTHLTGEALALYVAGTALPELRGSARWTDVGRRVLLHEIDRQICPDGGHAERSTHYHRYTLDFYLLALLTAERAGDLVAATAFRHATERLAGFMRAIADDRGVVPQLGDDDGGMLWPIAARDPKDVRDSLSLAAAVLHRPELAPWGLTETACWIAWSSQASRLAIEPSLPAPFGPAADGIRMDTYADTGYVIVRDGASDHLVFDTGALGYLNGGHAHADTLAMTLSVAGRPLLIDPGTATYTMDPALRDQMRGTTAHNTLTLDGRPSSTPAGPFHWRSRTDARLHTNRHTPRLAWVDASHDGFGSAAHRRTIVHQPGGGWLIVDDVVSGERHIAQTHWHFDPQWQITRDTSGRLQARTADGLTAWLLHDGDDLLLVKGDTASGLGWCSPDYGALVPTSTARVTRTAAAPFSMITWVGAGRDLQPPSLERLQVDGEATLPATAVRVSQGTDSIVTLIANGAQAGAGAATGWTVAEYHTDARLLQYSLAGRGLTTVSVADATHVLALHDGLLSLTSATPIASLSAELHDERLELWATGPMPALDLHGDALRRMRMIRLNGRDLPARKSGPADTIAIGRSDWAEPNERVQICVG